MTASTVKSSGITDIESSPITHIDRGFQGPVVSYMDQIAVATTSVDEQDDVILMVAVPSDLRVSGVYIKNDDLDSDACPTLAADVGIYYSGIGGNQKRNGKSSGDAVDVDAFGSAITSLQSANLSWVDVTNEALNITSIGKELWDIGGLSEDPGGLLYIGLKVTTAAATAAAGDIVIRVEGIL